LERNLERFNFSSMTEPKVDKQLGSIQSSSEESRSLSEVRLQIVEENDDSFVDNIENLLNR
jgi:hypothetical protein